MARCDGEGDSAIAPNLIFPGKFVAKGSKSLLSYLSAGASFQPLLAGIAQSVEQRTENPRVGGSSPPPGIILASLDR